MAKAQNSLRVSDMHKLYCGVTESGKTTLARAMARAYQSAGQIVIVRDPVGTGTAGGGWGENAIIFGHGEDEAFWKYLSNDRVFGAHVFIDECSDYFGVGQTENQWLLTRGRHYGLHVNLIAQRPKMIAPNVRNQVSIAYVFRLANDDMKEVTADMGHNMRDFDPLDKGDFYVLHSGRASIVRHNVFTLLESKRKLPQ